MVSNRVGLWYNLQRKLDLYPFETAGFQTELVCGIICNAQSTEKPITQVSVSNRVGLWYNLQQVISLQ